MRTLAFFKRLRAMGMDEAMALQVAEAFDEELTMALEAVLEPRRAKDRARKAAKVTTVPRNSAESTESAENPSPKNLSESSSTSENLQTPTPPKTPLTGVKKVPDDFERFWRAYPRKTAKDAARKAWPRALGRASLETMLAAIEDQQTWDEWQRGFVPHPATWLNQARWTDEQPQPPRQAHDRPHNDPRQTARTESLRANHAGAMAALNRRIGSVG